MIIENQETKKRYNITSSDWAVLKQSIKKAFEVIVADDNDGNQVVEAKKPMEHTQTTIIKPKKNKK